MADTSVQVVSYWDLNEVKEYKISNTKFKIQDKDTVSKYFSESTIQVNIIDSTENSYTLEWKVKSKNVDTEDIILKKLATCQTVFRYIYKVDECGRFIELINWQEIKDDFEQAFFKLKLELQTVPNIDMIVDQMEAMYRSRQTIETLTLMDLYLFHYFHGKKYNFNKDINTNIKIPNNFGDKAFDANTSIYIKEINPEKDYYVLDMHQYIDVQQLTNCTYDYITKSIGKEELKLLKDNFPKLTNKIHINSKISSSSGWPKDCIQTKTIISDTHTNIEEFKILEINK
jgi:hypothetical protein